jgi:hypothetical protein
MSSSTFQFKPRSFRLNRSAQYADQLWLKTVSTVVMPSTEGAHIDSVRAAYLPEGDAAVPSVFGVLSWQAPLVSLPAECQVQFHDGTAMVPAMTVQPSRTAFTGVAAAADWLEVGTGSNRWRIVPNEADGSLATQKWEDGAWVTRTASGTTEGDAGGVPSVLQVGSGSDAWRILPNTESGSLAIQRLEGDVWVTKSEIGDS